MFPYGLTWDLSQCWSKLCQMPEPSYHWTYVLGISIFIFVLESYFWYCIFTIPKSILIQLLPFLEVLVRVSLPQNLRLTLFASVQAWRLIFCHWKSEKPLSFTDWVKDILSLIPLEKLRYNRNKSCQMFIDTWGPFIEFVLTFIHFLSHNKIA